MDVTVLIPVHEKDVTGSWIRQARGSFPGGTPILTLPNTGDVAGALNQGLREATTTFVVPFGHDDVALPGFLDQMLPLGVYADVVYPSMTLTTADMSESLGDQPAWPFCPHRLMQMNYIPGPSLIRRSKALALGGFRDVPFEDWDLWVRMLRADCRFKPAPEARMLYRQVEGSRRRQVKDLEALRRQIVGEPDPLDAIKATFYSGATPATTYVRCQLPGRVLPAIVRPDINYRTNGGDIEFHEHRGDTAIFQFGANKTAAHVSGAMRGMGLRVLIEVDDNYLVNPGHRILTRANWGMRIGEMENTRGGHQWIAKWADGVIVSTPYLAEQYREVNPNVYVCPNSVDPVDWPEPVKPDDGVFRIVWFASQSHEDDIPIVTRAMEWASRQPSVEVWMVGLNPNTRLKFKERWRFPYGQVGWLHDLDDYRHYFQVFDLGLAPVSKNPTGLGRSDLKMLEYAAGGVFGICQDARPYDWWDDTKPCLKARNSEDFLKHVKWAVANQDEVRAEAQVARELVFRERTNWAQRHLYEQAVAG